MPSREQNDAFERRAKANRLRKRVNNDKLPAGAPMYYYCVLCGEEMILPETHIDPVPRYCIHCISEGRSK